MTRCRSGAGSRLARLGCLWLSLGLGLLLSWPAVAESFTQDKAFRAAYEAGDWAQALALLEGMKSDPHEQSRAADVRGNLLHRLGRLDEAIVAQRHALRLSPDDPDYLNSLCWYLLLQGNAAQARQPCLESVALFPAMQNALNLGHSYLLLGDEEQAWHWYREAAARVRSMDALQQGPVADFDLFIQRGWSVDVSRRARQWFLDRYAALEGMLEPLADVDPGIVSEQPDKVLAVYAAVLVRLREHQRIDSLVAATVAADKGVLLHDLRRQAEALPVLEQALLESEALRGVDHPVTGMLARTLADAYNRQGRFTQALEASAQALRSSEKTFDRPSVALLVSVWRHQENHEALGHRDESLLLQRRVLAMAEAIGEAGLIAVCLQRLGESHQVWGEYDEAQKMFERALAVSDTISPAEEWTRSQTLELLGNLQAEMGRNVAALASLQQALAAAERRHGADSGRVATVLASLATLQLDLADADVALASAHRALAIREKINGPRDPRLLAPLVQLGKVYKEKTDYSRAQAFMERALVITEAAGGAESLDTIAVLSELSRLNRLRGNQEQALQQAARALASAEKLAGGGLGVALLASELATIYQELDLPRQAIPLAERALAASRQFQGTRHPVTAYAMARLARLYQLTDRYEKALPLLQGALDLQQQSVGEEHPRSAAVLEEIARLYASMNNYAAALPLAQRGLEIRQKAYGEAHPTVGTSLELVADSQMALGDRLQALDNYERALQIAEAAYGPTHPVVAGALDNLAWYYRDMDDMDRALSYAQRSARLMQRSEEDSPLSRAGSFGMLASLYHDKGEYRKALALYQKELAIVRRVNGTDHPSAAVVLNGLAMLYRDMGRHEQAHELYEQSLRILVQNGSSPLAVARTHGGLASLLADQGLNDLAIYHGKQAVNGFQAMRGNLSSLDEQFQKTFATRYQVYYQKLARVLIEQGRLAEAQQVTAMLKEQELFEQVRRSGTASPRATVVDYTEMENRLNQRGQALGQTLSGLAQELEALKASAQFGALDGAAAQRRAELESLLEKGRADFNAYLAEIRATYQSLSAAQRSEIELLNLRQVRPLQNTLADLGHGAVLLHYVVVDRELKIILTTAAVQKAFSVPVAEVELNRAIHALREGTLSRSDVRRSARQLHDWLIAPVQAELDAAGAQVLMVALTGSLRYLPLAALHDGQQWLAQRYALSLYTEAARNGLQQRRPANDWPWRVDAFGLTRQIEGFEALPDVPRELAAIVGGEGLPGTVRMDQDFTERSLLDVLGNRPQVLHVASHFVFKPGSEAGSFLLLGDGGRLALSRIQLLSFSGVELLTLSACETAMSGGHAANGEEIEGFGALAQLGGAYSVMASLWPVADGGTAELMRQFYLTRQRTPGLPKAVALQKAQLALIGGYASGAVPPQDGARSATRMDVGAADSGTVPARGRHYAHPYYWAPFILMGNWL